MAGDSAGKKDKGRKSLPERRKDERARLEAKQRAVQFDGVCEALKHDSREYI